jgi:hypothetical protein
MTKNSKSFLYAVVLATVLAGGYWYFSPHLAMRAIHQAAQSKDADAFNDHVDYPKLRESLKGQMAALMGEKLGSGSQSGAETFGAALGIALLGPMVDAFVRPEMVMRAMQDGKFQPRLGRDNSDTNGAPAKEVRWDLQRKGINKVIAYSQESDSADGGPGFVFERYGFADWKLTEVRLPASK